MILKKINSRQHVFWKFYLISVSNQPCFLLSNTNLLLTFSTMVSTSACAGGDGHEGHSVQEQEALRAPWTETGFRGWVEGEDWEAGEEAGHRWHHPAYRQPMLDSGSHLSFPLMQNSFVCLLQWPFSTLSIAYVNYFLFFYSLANNGESSSSI